MSADKSPFGDPNGDFDHFDETLISISIVPLKLIVGCLLEDIAVGTMPKLGTTTSELGSLTSAGVGLLTLAPPGHSACWLTSKLSSYQEEKNSVSKFIEKIRK